MANYIYGIRKGPGVVVDRWEVVKRPPYGEWSWEETCITRLGAEKYIEHRRRKEHHEQTAKITEVS